MSTISVIIPTYNRADVLADAIRSVLEQSVEAEVVVADDGSQDNTEEVARGFGSRVSYVRQEHLGASAARNLGSLHSSGELMMFLDSDDVLLPGALEKLSNALDANPDCGVAYCGYEVTDAPGSILRVSQLDRPSGMIFRQVATDYLIIVHSGMVRRKCLAKSGLFDADLDQFEDIDFWMRVAANAAFVFVPERLVEYRRWQPGMSGESPRAARARAIMGKKLEVFRQLGWIEDDWMPDVRRRVLAEDTRTPSQKSAASAREAYERGDWRTAYGCVFRAFRYEPRMLARRSMWLLAIRAMWRSLTGMPAKQARENQDTKG